jgi:cytochrome c-type biogenesis protein CcmH
VRAAPIIAAAVLAGLLVPAAPAPAVITGDPVTDEALPRLVCICGGCPKLTLDTCTCGRAEELAAEALGVARTGKTADQVVEAFVDKYGPQVLAAPPPTGFNLALWFGPPLVLVLGAAGLYIYLRSRRSRSGPDEAEPAASGQAAPGLPGFDPFA